MEAIFRVSCGSVYGSVRVAITSSGFIALALTWRPNATAAEDVSASADAGDAAMLNG